MMNEVGFIAWWGACLSTLLGVIAIYDRFLRKPLPTTSYSFSSSDEIGNVIQLGNPNATPVMVKHWRLFWAKSHTFGLTEKLEIASPDGDDLTSWTIPPFGWHSLIFSESDHFGWGNGFVSKYGDIYIELHILGRNRPVILHVYPGPEPRAFRRLLPHSLRPRPRREQDAKS